MGKDCICGKPKCSGGIMVDNGLNPACPEHGDTDAACPFCGSPTQSWDKSNGFAAFTCDTYRCNYDSDWEESKECLRNQVRIAKQ